LVAELNWSLGVVAWEHERRLAAIAVLEGSALLQEKRAASGFFCVFLPHSAYVWLRLVQQKQQFFAASLHPWIKWVLDREESECLARNSYQTF